MSDPVKSPEIATKPAEPVIFTAEDTQNQHLGTIAENLDDALNMPHQSNAKTVQSQIEGEPLSAEVKKQAEDYEASKAPIDNPVDPDHPLRHIVPLVNPKVGNVGAREIFKKKLQYVRDKGGQKRRPRDNFHGS